MYILEGLFLGFASILLVGPVVFVLINASVFGGFKSGLAVALGIIFGDIIYTFATYKSLGFLINNKTFELIMAYAGFIILLLVGFSYLFKKTIFKIENDTFDTASFISNFTAGFSINFFNPFVLSIWLMVVNYAKTSHSEHPISFLISALLGIFLIDLFKVNLSKKFLPFLKSEKIKLFYKLSGVVMIIFSLRILYFILTY